MIKLDFYWHILKPTLILHFFISCCHSQCNPKHFRSKTVNIQKSACLAAHCRRGMTVAGNHPASASSEAPGHVARMANDGKMTTSWQAADGDANPRWQLDIEGLYSIESVAISFSDSGHYQ